MVEPIMAGSWTRRVWAAIGLVMIYAVVAAAAFDGFYQKWRFRDDVAAFSIADVFDGASARPWAYRRLLPDLIDQSIHALPPQGRAGLERSLYRRDGSLVSGLRSPVASDQRYALRYHLLYGLVYLTFLGSLFALRRLCLAAGAEPLPAIVAPALLMLFLPLLMTKGGYYYDAPELLFMALAALACMSRLPWLLVPIAMLGAWNKESFLFFLPALLPFLREHFSTRLSYGLLAAAILAAGGVYLRLRLIYVANVGLTVEGHLAENLAYWLDPASYLGFEATYGLMLPQPQNVLVLILLVGTFISGWRHAGPALRGHVLLAGAINLPLFLLFCAPGERRNLSMLYAGFVMLAGLALNPSVRRPSATALV